MTALQVPAYLERLKENSAFGLRKNLTWLTMVDIEELAIAEFSEANASLKPCTTAAINVGSVANAIGETTPGADATEELEEFASEEQADSLDTVATSDVKTSADILLF